MFDLKEVILISISLIYVTLIAQIAILPIVRRMWSILEKEAESEGIKEKVKPRTWQGMILGVIERILFLLSLISGQVQFIGLWLGLKTVSQYKRWSENEIGRATFNIFLIGNGLSLLYAVAGYEFVEFGRKICTPKTCCLIDITLIFLILLAPVILSVIFYKILEEHEKNVEEQKEKRKGERKSK
jgi:hypothetical protein